MPNPPHEASFEPTPRSTDSPQFDLGNRLIGPVLAEYLLKLDGTIRLFEGKGDFQALFVSRTGMRIRQALELFLTTCGRPLPQTSQHLWVSHLMIAKGIWNRQQAMALSELSSRFSGHNVDDILNAIQGSSEDANSRSNGSHNEPVEDIGDFLQSDALTAKSAREQLEADAALFEDYIQSVTKRQKRSLLIDADCSGGAQRLLSKAFPEHDWWGAYFGFYNQDGTDQVINLISSNDRLDPNEPESSLCLNRHLFEAILEPGGQSIERLQKDASGIVFSPEAATTLNDHTSSPDQPIFSGAMDYLATLPDGKSSSEIHRAATIAWRKLAELIVLPTKSEAIMLSGLERPRHFGQLAELPLLQPAGAGKDDDTIEMRINASSWPLGQISIEYPIEIARNKQLELSGISREDSPISHKKMKQYSTRDTYPAVAIITRTRDRPLFLTRALQSLYGQTFTDYVHIVVNDGGNSDLVEQTIHSANCHDNKLRLIDTVADLSIGPALNAAAAACNSKYIAIHNDTDSWDACFLEKAISFLEAPENEMYNGVSTHFNLLLEQVSLDGIHSLQEDPQSYRFDAHEIPQLTARNLLPSVAFVFRRDAFDEIGGFNEKYPLLVDWDFKVRFALSNDIGVIKETLANHHQSSEPQIAIEDRPTRDNQDLLTVVRNKVFRSLPIENRIDLDCASLSPFENEYVSCKARIDQIKAAEELHDDLTAPISPEQHSDEAVSSDTEFRHTDNAKIASAWSKMRLGNRDFQALIPYLRFSTVEPLLQKLGAGSQLRQSDEVVEQYLCELRAANYPVVPARDFDEAAYLLKYPDVAQAVASGAILNGYQHYLFHGREEGRTRPSTA